MTNRAEFERLLDVYGFRCERFGQDLSTHARAQVVSAFAALASAPVAEPETMEEIHRQERERSPWKLPKDPTLPDCAPVTDESPMAKMADALREKARQEQQAYQDRRNQATEWGPMPEGTEADNPTLSAPVAGEATSVIPGRVHDIVRAGATIVLHMESAEAAQHAYNAIEGAHRVAVNIEQSVSPVAGEAQKPVAKVVDGGPFGPTLRFLGNGKPLPKVGTMLYAAPQASTVDGLPVWWGRFMIELTLRSEDEVRNDLPGILEICALEAIGSVAPQASEAVRQQRAEVVDELARLREALQFYAHGNHYHFFSDTWDTCSGEPQNFWFDEAETGMIEDGSVARAALSAQPGAQNDAN